MSNMTGWLDGLERAPARWKILTACCHILPSIAVLLALAAPAHAASPKATIYSFQGGVDGGIPEAGLTGDTDGALYGVSSGGPQGSGLVFKVTPPAPGSTSWTKTTLYAFRGGADGGFPQAGLTFDSDGALYGATREGGANGAGTVFRLSPPLTAGGAWTKTTLYSFRGGADGAQPLAGLAMDTDGTLYGVTNQQGARGAGTVYALQPPAPGSTTWTKATIYAFQGGADGANPYGGVVLDTNGALYGTTAYGGHRGAGTVYKIAPPSDGATAWTKSTLYSFDGVEGNFPRATVTFGTDGALYGVTYGGGAFNGGTAYRLTPPAGAATAWTKATIYSFKPGVEGSNPFSELTFDTAGALYGANFNGGPSGGGAVFKLTPSGANWSASVVYAFGGGADGQSPGGLVFDDKGTIYGVTMYGGARWNGSVFQISLPAPAPAARLAAHMPVYGFRGGADGGNPQFGAPIFDSKGAVYLATASGGAKNQGAVVKIEPTGAQTVLYSFTGGADGANPLADLTFDSEGAIYGTTVKGGKGYGVAFRLKPPSEKVRGWTQKVIYTFTGGADGGAPQSGVVFDTDGRLFGAASSGGLGYGVIYRLKSNEGAKEWKQDVLYSFAGKADGASPVSGVIFDTDGTLYGTTQGGGLGYGVAWKLEPNERSTESKKWTYSTLYSFRGGADGDAPFGLLNFDNHGSLYGVTLNGGAGGGTAYRLAPTKSGPWTKSIVYSFRGGADGAAPNGLTFDTQGALYGATRDGGDGRNGLVFKLTPGAAGAAWTKSLLYKFSGSDGGAPLSGVTFDTQGRIYGTTSRGGAGGAGTLFRLKSGD